MSLAERLRPLFPALDQEVHGRPLVYLDNAATTQRPLPVLDAWREHLLRDNANVHRGVHALSERATRAYEGARERVRGFLNAPSAQEVVFVRGTTEAINLAATGLGWGLLEPGDEVVLSEMEHHSNIVPWQLLRERRGIGIKVLPVDERGELALDRLPALLGPRTRLVAVTHVSNALGTVNDIPRIARLVHEAGAWLLVDGAQATGHLPVDVQALGADLYAFSGHKMYGPDGIGVLWARRELLERMAPYQGGGDMILSVTFERSTYQEPPHRFEAGTPFISGAVGLAAALDFLEGLGWDAVQEHERELLAHAEEELRKLPGLRVLGQPARRSGALSFVVEGVHPHDLATLLDLEGVAVRAGHHCAQPLLARFGVPATTRASFAAYNDHEDVERLLAALRRARRLLA